MDWGLDSSDHGAVIIYFNKKNREWGGGIRRYNNAFLKDKQILHKCKNDLKDMLSQIPTHWNPHLQLDYAKMAIRTILTETNIKHSRSNKLHKEGLEREINSVHKELEAQIQKKNEIEILKCQNTIAAIDPELGIYRDIESRYLANRAKTKWYNEGENSNKYFLNIIKKSVEKQNIKTIIDSNGHEINTIKEKLDEAKEYYTKLYKKQQLQCPDAYLANSNTPKLNQEQNIKLIAPITETELEQTLKSCKDSAPGSDGLTYSTYKFFWDEIKHLLVHSWNHSLKEGYLPEDHRTSTITLIPKKDKDTRYLQNLRPISLSNCDAKIITKTLSNRLKNILPNIIHRSQTAYTQIRQVHDNLNLIDYCKKSSEKLKQNIAIVSLDAKKAFDSIDHNYIYKCLELYGFHEKFINIVKVLYRDLKAKVMINGHILQSFNVEQSVKQGDALLCALFIIGIDPLLRYYNKNMKTQNPILGWDGKYLDSTAAYADDVTIITKNDVANLKEIFKEYKRFSRVSGLQLNADKTEILSNSDINLNIEYMNQSINIKNTQEVKICGKVFSTQKDIETNQNINVKIAKLKKQLEIWSSRNLTVIGKILIVKKFGMSQLIFFMQNTQYTPEHLTNINEIITNFIWSGKRPKIKYNILINDYDRGGLKAPDAESMYEALKLKQFIRTQSLNHSITDCTPKIDTILNDTHKGATEITNIIKSLIKGMYKDYIALNKTQQTKDHENKLQTNIINCPVDMFAAKCAENSIVLFKRKYTIKTVKDLLNEIIFPCNDDHILNRQIIKNN